MKCIVCGHECGHSAFCRQCGTRLKAADNSVRCCPVCLTEVSDVSKCPECEFGFVELAGSDPQLKAYYDTLVEDYKQQVYLPKLRQAWQNRKPPAPEEKLPPAPTAKTAPQPVASEQAVVIIEEPTPTKSSRKLLFACLAIVAMIVLVILIKPWNFSPIQQETPAPDVVGMQVRDAENKITNKGLKVFYHYVSSDVVSTGYVVSQTPSANVRCADGTTIELYISTGPAAPNAISVPTVTDKTQAEATAALEAAGFRVIVENEYNASYASGMVCDQSHIGTQNAGETITITISKGPPPATSITVPSLVGKTESQAMQALIQAGFTNTTITTMHDENTEHGRVISYSPTGNQPKDTAISINLSIGTAGKWVSQSDLAKYPSDKYLHAETKTEYKYRSREKEYAKNGYPSYTGYTLLSKELYKATTTGNWTSAVVSTSTSQGATYETDTTSEAKSVYKYWVWVCSNKKCYLGVYGGTQDCTGCSGAHNKLEIYTTLSWTPWDTDISDSLTVVQQNGPVYYITWNGAPMARFTSGLTGSYNHLLWVHSKETSTIYRQTTDYYQYTHWRWGEWGASGQWSLSVPSNTDSTQYEISDTQYSYYVIGK